MKLVVFFIATVAILGASCGYKKVGDLVVNNSTPFARYWNKGKIPYEISQQFGTVKRGNFETVG